MSLRPTPSPLLLRDVDPGALSRRRTARISQILPMFMSTVFMASGVGKKEEEQ